MIEIKETSGKLASNSANAIKIECIVRAWFKVDTDDSYSDEQRNIVTRAAMSEIWRIMEEIHE